MIGTVRWMSMVSSVSMSERSSVTALTRYLKGVLMSMATMPPPITTNTACMLIRVLEICPVEKPTAIRITKATIPRIVLKSMI